MAQKDSTGTYTCVARNKLGMAKNEVHLEIKGKTELMNVFKYYMIQSKFSSFAKMDNNNFEF